MRDPNRIDPLLEKLRQAWQAYPDMRLGQLVVALSSYASNSMDPFYVEDDKMSEAIDKFMAEHKG